jgi:hypothetical protein
MKSSLGKLLCTTLLLAGTATDAAPPKSVAAEDGALVARGQSAARSENFAEAMRWYLAAAGKGNAQAMLMLGDLYTDGRGVAKDPQEALRWYRAAAAKGNAEAMWRVGMAYLIGTAAPKDDAQGVRWFKMSAAKGDQRGQNSLGVMLKEGKGIARNPAEALRLFQLSADQGNSAALYNMAAMYRDGLGVAKDEEEAYRLTQAARSSDPRNWRNFVVQIAPATLVAPQAGSSLGGTSHPNWMSDQGWIFFDLNSITRSGSDIFVNVGHGLGKDIPPPASERGVRFRINCARLEVESLGSGRIQKVSRDYYFIKQVCK